VQRSDGKLEGEYWKTLKVQGRKEYNFLLELYKQTGNGGIGSKDNG